MFGNHELLERKLRKKGKAATATVLTFHKTISMTESVNGSIPVTKYLCTVDVSVQPGGEPAFETTTDAWFSGLEPSPGTVVPVLYDPSDHSKLVVDHSDTAQVGAAVDTALGRRVAEGADPASMTGIADMMRSAVSDPQAFKKLMREQGPAAFGVTGQMQGTPLNAAPAAADPLDRLTKLADLHDRGVLSDTEFETEKKKLLAE
jgi:hypothetical protein